MSMGNKYTSCGCNPCKSNYTTCCYNPVQPAPTPCCESHDIKYVNSICLFTVCPVTATETPFYIKFSNDSGNSVPFNAADVYFYHAVAGLMKILIFTGDAYQVELVDPTKVGSVINPADCILVEAIPASILDNISSFRCLSGNFLAPALNANATIFIENGTGIPIGATLTFLDNAGNSGSYLVIAFVSATGNIYAYTIQNTGMGHTPGTLIDGGPVGICNIPIEVITDVSICNNPETTIADNFAACVSGTPRSFVSSGPGYIPYGDEDGGWEQRVLTDVACCITILGCLKFSGATCPTASDQVEISSTNIQCFVDALTAAQLLGQNLPMTIEGFPVVVTAYDSGTNIITVVNASDEELAEPIEFPEGSQLCITSCCYTCNNGPENTNPQLNTGDIDDTSVYSLTPTFTAPIGVSHWLIGYNTVGAVVAQNLPVGYWAAPSTLGPDLPKIDDALVVRQKICNTSDKGCNQFCTVNFNYQFMVHEMPADMTVDWEVAHYAQESEFLSDGTTPNPFFFIATQQKSSGRLSGPSDTDGLLTPSSFGIGGPGVFKAFPLDSGDLRDFITINKCDCALSIVWCFLRIDAGTEAEITAYLGLRRQMHKVDLNSVANAINDTDSENFNS